MDCLERICGEENIAFNRLENHIRCIAHIINLAVQDALKMLKTGDISEQDVKLNVSNALVTDLVPKVSEHFENI